MNKLVYIAYTPYHIFLALLMAYAKSRENVIQHLVIVANFADAELMNAALQNSADNPFVKVSFLDGEYNLQKYGSFRRGIARYWGGKRICADLLSLIKKEDFKTVYLFNEERPYSLYLLNYIKKTRGDVRVSLVEDGAITYNSYVENKNWKYLFLGKLAYGLWWRNIEVMGVSTIFDDIFVLFPNFVRPELKRKEIRQIPSVVGIEKMKKSGIAAKILNNYGISSDDVRRFNCVILLSHSTVIKQSPEYKDMILRVIKKAQALGYAVAIKYHPRDNGDFLALQKEPNVYCLRGSAPLELIYVVAKDSIKLVIADASTSLLSALLIIPEARVVSTGALLGSKDLRFLNMVESLGAKLPKNFEEFAHVL